MTPWWKRNRRSSGVATEESIRSKYSSFRELLSLNNECLEVLASLQEDLQIVPPRSDLLGGRIGTVCERAAGAVAALGRLTGRKYSTLTAAVAAQRQEVEAYVAACQERAEARLAAWLSEVDGGAAEEVGGKAAALGEIKNKLKLPVPDGYVLTVQAYRRFCGIPLWTSIRDLSRNVDLNDLEALQAISGRLTELIMASPIPRAVESAITERALAIARKEEKFAVRSSAVGEGGERSFAGQFISLINVPVGELAASYKRVVAGRFSARALSYRLSTGTPEVESPMAVLFLPVIRARASGIMYTRDPKDPRKESLWVTATRGLGLDIASGRMSADLFVLSRERSHSILDEKVVRKDEEILPGAEGGLVRRPLNPDEARAPSLGAEDLQVLADWGVRIEEHLKGPQDVEWALDEEGKVWILQSRPLTMVEPGHRVRSRVRVDPILAGGHSIYPGRISGQAYLAGEPQNLRKTPSGALLVVRRASPEIVSVFPRIVGLVAEWGNPAGHAAALLREFKIPSVFQMPGVFDTLATGDPISLDAVQPRIYRGTHWPVRKEDVPIPERYRERPGNPISRRLLTLHLLNPSAFSFRPGGCKSTHDVLRYCHEKAIEAMFALNDSTLDQGPHSSKKLLTPMPVNLYVLDLGGGLTLEDPRSPEVQPSQISSKPFQALWKGVSHPGVTWTREMPASISDLASVMASSISTQSGAMRALGERSYLLVADEYINLNSRLAYHFTLVDACLSKNAGNNYISFRFAGGGASRPRRNLRACFIEACLLHYGFLVVRRGDLVNAWLKKASAEETEFKLDILGRLMACTSQLDMYMTSEAVMKWYVRQFLRGNYAFRLAEDPPAGSGTG